MWSTRSETRSAYGERVGELWGAARAVARALRSDRRDERARRADVVGAGAPQHLPKRLHRLPGAGRGLYHLAGTQGQEPDGGLPRAEERVLPGGLARRHRRRVDGHGLADGRPRRLPAGSGDARGYARALRPGLLRGVQGVHGLRPPLRVSTPASRACQHAPADASACQHASALAGLALSISALGRSVCTLPRLTREAANRAILP